MIRLLRSCSALAGLLLCAAGVASPVTGRPVLLEVRANVDVASDQVRLADLVQFDDAGAAKELGWAEGVVASAPQPGQILRIDRHRLLQAAAKLGLPASTRWNGAVVSEVRRATQEVSGPALCAATLEAVRQQAAGLPKGALFDVRCDGELAPIAVPAGKLDIRPVVLSVRLVEGLQEIPAELVVGNRLQRTVRQPVLLRVEAAQWCARDGLVAGSDVSEAHFIACRRPVLRDEQLVLANQPLPRGRLLRDVRAGDVLEQREVADLALQMRGDPVTVVYRIGALELESRGELSQDARVGDAVRVRLQSASQMLVGRLSAPHRVELGEQ